MRSQLMVELDKSAVHPRVVLLFTARRVFHGHFSLASSLPFADFLIQSDNFFSAPVNGVDFLSDKGKKAKHFETLCRTFFDWDKLLCQRKRLFRVHILSS